jgi:hypothetical protein
VLVECGSSGHEVLVPVDDSMGVERNYRELELRAFLPEGPSTTTIAEVVTTTFLLLLLHFHLLPLLHLYLALLLAADALITLSLAAAALPLADVRALASPIDANVAAACDVATSACCIEIGFVVSCCVFCRSSGFKAFFLAGASKSYRFILISIDFKY